MPSKGRSVKFSFMELVIKNIAKIRNASIRLDGLTVIAGINNTGKSTIGKSLFAICDAFYDTSGSIRALKISNIARIIAKSISKNFHFYSAVKPLITDAEDIFNVSDSVEKMRVIIERIPNKVLKELIESEDVSGEVKERFNPSLKNFSDYVNEVLKDVVTTVAISYEALISGIVRRTINREFKGQICCAFNKREGILQLSRNKDKVSLTFYNDSPQTMLIDNYLFRAEKATYIDNVVMFDDNSGDDDQSSKFNGHRRSLRAALLKMPEEFNLLDNISTHIKLSDILKKVSDISTGTLIKDDDNWFYNIVNKDGQFSFTVDNVSTGILTFATLRRLIENGTIQESDILILDEPETHLHPQWQNVLAEIIVLLCKDFDLKVLINTHSHYFLAAIEAFSKKHGVNDKCKYYLSLERDNMVDISDVSGNLDEIYKELFQPIQDIRDIEEDND